MTLVAQANKGEQSMTHQGYANYATFGVAVTLDNDQTMSNALHQIVFAAIDNAPADENVRENIWTVEETERFRAVEGIKSYVEDLVERGSPHPMAAQMVQAGLCEVDWDELAADYIESAKTEWER